jgi:hypothetical protein
VKRTMQWLAAFVLIGALTGLTMAEKTPARAKKPNWDGSRIILFDTDTLPPGYPETNPYNILVSLNSWSTPVLDHTGKPHHHGHVVQVIMDGGNWKQDPPNPDGSPGGDDSMAFGNFNMTRIMGVEDMYDSLGQSGLLSSWKYFVPFQPGRAYYLRLWDGNSVASAPYYQDTIEYDGGSDRGGAIAQFREGVPMDVDWKFGPCKPRPKPDAPKPKQQSKS